MPDLTQVEGVELRRATENLDQFEALLLRWGIEFSDSERQSFLDFYNQMKHFFTESPRS